MRKTQNEMILEYMKEFGVINPFIALREIGTMKLSTRISELRRDGINIASDTVFYTNSFGEKKHYKKYWLAD